MKRIKILSDSVKKKIAAGEVVEGPFSIVKELIENSIDANSTRIDIQVIDGGLKKILVRDNGDGIFKDDVELSIMEHSTSKIDDVYDIEKISSYGFRGEALSSISSISGFTILTRTRDNEIGTRLVSSDGVVSVKDYAGPAGTTVIVENLFYNIPARKKFLKTRRTELRYIRETFLKITIPVPSIGFSLDVDGKRQITLNPVETIEERLKQVYGKDIMHNLYFEMLKDLKVTISGFLSKPNFLKSSRTMQHLYINNRPVENKYFGYHLSRAYEAISAKGRYPAALIFIEIDPTLVDVNIHPAKREVKLFDQQYIDSLIFHLAEKALNKQHKVNDEIFKAPEDNPVHVDDNQIRIYESKLPFGYEHKYGGGTNHSGLNNSNYSLSLESQSGVMEYGSMQSLVKDVPELNETGGDAVDIRILGVIFNTYILIERGDSVYIIDFHAVHERIIYDSLAGAEDSFEKQELIFPSVMELSVEDFGLIIDNISIFSEIGIDIDDFSDNTITIRSVPEIAKNVDCEGIIKDFIESVKEEKENNFDIREKIIASIACHSAKRSGEKLSYEDIEFITRKVFHRDHEMRCPHGRPYIYEVNKTDLDRIFKRL